MSDAVWMKVREPAYFRGVLGSIVSLYPNARHDDRVLVRFGITGEGVHPNYQVEGPEGLAFARLGNNHGPDKLAIDGRYADDKLSTERFAFADVQDLLKKCLERASGPAAAH